MKTPQIILLFVLVILTACNNNTKNNSENQILQNDMVSEKDLFQKVADLIEKNWKINSETELKKSANGRVFTEVFKSSGVEEELPVTGMTEYSIDTVYYSDFDKDGKMDALVSVGCTFGSSSMGIYTEYYLYLNSANEFEYVYKFDNTELAQQLMSKSGQDFPGRFELQKIDGNKLTGNAFYWPQYGIANYVTDTVEKMEFTYNKDTRQFELSYSSDYIKMERVEE